MNLRHRLNIMTRNAILLDVLSSINDLLTARLVLGN